MFELPQHSELDGIGPCDGEPACDHHRPDDFDWNDAKIRACQTEGWHRECRGERLRELSYASPGRRQGAVDESCPTRAKLPAMPQWRKGWDQGCGVRF